MKNRTVSIQVADNKGILIKKFQNIKADELFELDLSDQADGYYMVNIYDHDHIISRKISLMK